MDTLLRMPTMWSAAEQKVLGLEQYLRTEGKVNKKDVLPGLVPLLTRLVDSLCLGPAF